MSARYLLLLGLLIAGLTSCSTERAPARSPAQLVEEGVTAAEAWLELVDTGRYSESWDEAASLFRASIGREAWTEAVRSVRAPLGPVVSRNVQSASFTRTLPGAPDGEYVVVVYQSDFSNAGAVETVTPMRDSDGRWRVSGYFVK